MSWGLPPKYKKSLNDTGSTHEEKIDRLSNILQNDGYSIESRSPYTLHAKKKLGFTFYSFFQFAKPVLDLNVRADEDGNLNMEMSYLYSSGYASTFNDLGKCKKNVEGLLNEFIK